MNVIELLADLQALHEKATARAGELHAQIKHLTAALVEIEARLTDWRPPGKSSPNSHRPKKTPIEHGLLPLVEAPVHTVLP
ncbi:MULTISPECIES: hypothetical protein [unclassified Streptomyces]|uniref:hypothetical protein n=1 Tax=unclassified Streptomyces TaxID=2593676 RepID=UPI0004C1A7CE|nr:MULTISPECIES: hypothetical protein [unclassified Streptomyces]